MAMHAKQAKVGSPPPSWGQLACHRHPQYSTRFTPTRVGTTLSFPTAFLYFYEPEAVEVSHSPARISRILYRVSLLCVNARDAIPI